MKKIISPHVNIYKFPITAISSISTRLSGFYLSTLFVAGGIYSLTNSNIVEKKYESLPNYQKRIINMSLIVPSTYHTLGGIRHFIWDKYPKLLENNKVSRSSFLLFGLTLGSSFIFEKLYENNKK